MRSEARDVDFKGGLVQLWETKAKRPRSVPMTSRVRAVLERRVAQHVAGKGLFPGGYWSLQHAFSRVRSMAGLGGDEQVTLHVLRHTCASRLVQRGIPIQVVQAWLGHKTIQITLRYAHLAPANLMSAAAVLEPVQQTASTDKALVA